VLYRKSKNNENLLMIILRC